MNSQVEKMVKRYDLTDCEAATLFGVPITTFRSWKVEGRNPSASVIRLIEVIEVIEMFSPIVHAALLNNCKNDIPIKDKK